MKMLNSSVTGFITLSEDELRDFNEFLAAIRTLAKITENLQPKTVGCLMINQIPECQVKLTEMQKVCNWLDETIERSFMDCE